MAERVGGVQRDGAGLGMRWNPRRGRPAGDEDRADAAVSDALDALADRLAAARHDAARLWSAARAARAVARGQIGDPAEAERLLADVDALIEALDVYGPADSDEPPGSSAAPAAPDGAVGPAGSV